MVLSTLRNLFAPSIAGPSGSKGRFKHSSWLLLVLLTLSTEMVSCARSQVTSKVPFIRASEHLHTAPIWGSTSVKPHRPASCPPLRGDPNSATPGQVSSLTGEVPWPPISNEEDPSRAVSFDHTPEVFPPFRPSNWGEGEGSTLLTSARSHYRADWANPQELCGVMGNSVDTAWLYSTGSPTTVIAVVDSGIEWCDPALVNKIYLNKAALPLPEDMYGLTKPQAEALGERIPGKDPYDLNGTGVFNVAQYAHDPRVLAVAQDYGGFFCATHASGKSYGYSGISAADLIRTFGRPTLPGGRRNPYYLGEQSPAGFTEAIAGWNFVNNNNDPYDVVHYDHGTGEAEDSAAAANTLNHEVGACPNCMVMPIRVGDSFMTSANLFAQGVLFAVDAGASVIQEALGTYDVTELARQAVAYADAHGVPIIASAADEESEHHNLPALLSHMIVVNSMWKSTSFKPPSYLYLNGCTNYGANIAVTVESKYCSSQATGQAAGIVGLLESEAHKLMVEHRLTPYPGLFSPQGKPVPLSVNEVRQLLTMNASSVNFETPAGGFPANDYAVSTGIPFVKTTRYPTKPGFNIYTGYGRINAATMIGALVKRNIPPQAEMESLPWFERFSPNQTLAITALVGSPGSTDYRWQLDVTTGVQPSAGSWKLLAEGHGKGVHEGVLAKVALGVVARLFHGGKRALSGGAVNSKGLPEPDKFTFSIRLVVENSKGLIGMSRRAEFLHENSSLLTSVPMKFNSSIDTAPTLAPIGPGGENVLLVATADGNIYAFLPNGKELPGWPVHTAPLNYHRGETAFTSHQVTIVPRGELIDMGGGLAVGDLTDAHGHSFNVVATDLTGRVYAWNSKGKLLKGFPVRTNARYSTLGATGSHNRLLRGIFSAAALADLSGNRQLDIVAAAMDRHVYAWQPNGRPVRGWPVLVVNPAEVASVNPLTNKVSFKDPQAVMQGSKLVDTPAIGDLNGGSGPPDVIVGSNEEYEGSPSAQLGFIGLLLGKVGLATANSEVYAIHPDGTLHRSSPLLELPPGDPDHGAFLSGWPVSVADLDPGMLPDVGDGISNSPALARLPGRHSLDVAVMSSVGPLYLLTARGKSALGTSDGLAQVASLGPPGSHSDGGSGLLATSIPALGAPSFGQLLSSSKVPYVMAPALSAGYLLDLAEVADQRPHYRQLDAWSTTDGQFAPGFPHVMNDMQFFDQPIVANVAPSRVGPYVVEGSALYDLQAVNYLGEQASGFPKFTGGWMVNSAAFGRFGRLRTQVLVAATREGYLYVWPTTTPACASSGPWPMAHHDLWNTNNLQTKAAPHSAVPRCR